MGVAWESLTTRGAALELSSTLHCPPCTATCLLASFVERFACGKCGRGEGHELVSHKFIAPAETGGAKEGQRAAASYRDKGAP